MEAKYYLSKSSLACYPKFEVDHENFPVFHDDLIAIDEPTFTQVNRVKNGDAVLEWQGDVPVVREHSKKERAEIETYWANSGRRAELWIEFEDEYGELYESALAGIITDDERKRMASLLKYRRALSKIDANDKAPAWPDKPKQ